MVSPPLGLMYLSAALKAANFRDVEVLHGDLYSEKVFLEKIASSGADVVGLSAINAEGASLHAAAAAARQGRPGAFVVCGGHYPSADPAGCLADRNIDAVAQGEGETTLVEAVKALGGGGLDAVAGLWTRREGKPFLPARRPFLKDLDALPLPDWDAVDAGAYSRHVPQTPLLYGARYMSLMTSRGCPYRCVFCHGLMGREFRAHTPARVLAEVGELYRRGFRNLEIADDVFNYDRERALAIFGGLAGRFPGLRLYFCGIRSDLLDGQLLDAMKSAGTVYFATGLETGDARLQGAIGKGVDLARFSGNVRLAAEKGIFTTGGFIFGFPGETLGQMLATARYAASTRLHTAMMATCLVYPGTELARSGAPALTPAADDGTYAGFSGAAVPGLKVAAVKLLANFLFYCSPSRAWRILRDLPDRRPAVLWLLLKKLFFRTVFPR